MLASQKMKNLHILICLVVYALTSPANAAEELKYKLKLDSPLTLSKTDGRYWLKFKGNILVQAKYKITYNKYAEFGEEVVVRLYPINKSKEVLPIITERGKLETVKSIELSHLNAPHYDILGDKLKGSDPFSY